MQYPTLEEVLTYFFNAGGHEIRKKEPTYVPPTAQEFLQEVRSTLRSSISKTMKGGSENRIQLFTNKLMGIAVGTFDTPCNKLLSYFAFVVWASFFYVLAVSFFQLPESKLIHAFANPVFAMLDLLQGRIGSGMGPLREMKQRIDEFVETTLPNIPNMVGMGLKQVIMALFNSQGYTHLVENTLACLLLRLGEFSCRDKCRI